MSLQGRDNAINNVILVNFCCVFLKTENLGFHAGVELKENIECISCLPYRDVKVDRRFGFNSVLNYVYLSLFGTTKLHYE